MEDHDVRRIYELLDTLAVNVQQGFANQEEENASLRQDISELRSDVRANAAAIVELREAIVTLDGKVDRFHRILGEHDVDIRVLKRAVSHV